MALQERLVRGHRLARDNSIPVEQLDVVDHEKGRSVRQDGFDGAGIELHGPRYFFLLGAALPPAAAGAEPFSSPEL